MAFESLGDKFAGIFKKMRGNAKIGRVSCRERV